MQIDEQRIALIVESVLKQIQVNQQAGSSEPVNRPGVFSDIDTAVKAAVKAQQELERLSLEQRGEFISAIREVSIANAKEWARLAWESTGMGRVADKTVKNINAARLTPGIEDIKPLAGTGDDGLVLVERAPFGAIASIEPATHPVACLINHAIAMLSGGNSIFFLPHPKGLKCAMAVVQAFNKVIIERGGPANSMVVLDEVRLEDVSKVAKHPGINLVVATGGPAVVEIALSSGKKAIAAGPGNPPVVVDETADLPKTARDIVVGATFDNNILCIAEKVIIAIDSIADRLMAELQKQNTLRLTGGDVERLTRLVTVEGHINGKYVGKDASVILKDLEIQAAEDVRAIVIEVPPQHPLVELEQMMPVLPFVRVNNFEDALQLALKVEHGFGHTAMIHSNDIDRITRYTRAMNTTIVVANAPSAAGLAVEGEGVYSHTIASPTGEGVTTVRTFTRERRLAVGRSLRIV
ncbi:MAG: aldehyde dehydrogenase EutE [Clostridia bacterium]|nr:aldehyde dehydrogenase EutE [Clostridia bacterium]